MTARGSSELDVLIITGDAYVDHPAFGPVLIARFLEDRGCYALLALLAVQQNASRREEGPRRDERPWQPLSLTAKEDERG